MTTKTKPKAEKTPKKMGRPTLYRPEYCERVVKMGETGDSMAQIAVALGVARPTLLLWADEHAEFMTALARAREGAQAWWESVGKKGIDKPPSAFNAQHWKTVMANRFREDYTEKQAVEVSGPAGGPITVALNVNFKPPPADA